MRVLLDLDGTLVNILAPIVSIYNENSRNHLEFKDLTSYTTPFLGFTEFWKTHVEEIYRRATPYKNSGLFLNNLYELCKNNKIPVLFYSCCVEPTDFEFKYRVVSDFYGEKFAKLLKTGQEKISLITNGDIIVDDAPNFLNYAKHVGAHPVCVAQPWNQYFSKPKWTGERYDDYDEILRVIARLLSLTLPEKPYDSNGINFWKQS